MNQLYSLDIETYGILEGKEQTVFHPVKSTLVDKVPRNQLIVTVAIATRLEGSLQCGLYVWEDPHDRLLLRQWFRYFSLTGATLLGHHLLFDLTYLRYCDPLIRHWSDIRSTGTINLDDTMIINFLDFESRPEKSLKSLSTLLGLGSYDTTNDRVLGSFGNATGPYDQDLHYYNAKDAIHTLTLYEELHTRLRERYGDLSSKLTAFCRNHRNNLLRLGLEMTEAGICFNENLLTEYRSDYDSKTTALQDKATSLYHLVLSGKGSKTSRENAVKQIFSSHGLIDDTRVRLTKVHQDVSCGKDNLELALSELPPDSRDYNLIHLMHEYTLTSKIISSYFKPLLQSPLKGALRWHSHRIAFPSWHLVPGTFKGSNDSLGTIQGRITASKPGVQTFPPVIKKTITSRFPGGHILSADYKQLEIVVAAFLSQDPVMLNNHATGIDVHTASGLMITDVLGLPVDTASKEFRGTWRQAGKTLNFLVLYRGGAYKYRETLLSEAACSRNYELLKILNERMPLEACEDILKIYNQKYAVFRHWQDQLIETAIDDGYLELPTGWSRSFPGGRAVIRKIYINEICNFPVQCLAAQITQNAQALLVTQLKQEKLRTRNISQTYDSIMLDIPANEVKKIREILEKVLPNPPLCDIFKDKAVTPRFNYDVESRQCINIRHYLNSSQS